MVSPLRPTTSPAVSSTTSTEPAVAPVAPKPIAPPPPADRYDPTPVTLAADAVKPVAEKLLPWLSNVGPRLNHIDDGWTPQGQGYDAGRGEVLSTYYKDAPELLGIDIGAARVLLSVQSKTDGTENLQVELGGSPAPGHGGGVSTNGDQVYVADTDQVYVYERSELEAAAAEGRSAVPAQQLKLDTDDVKDPATGLTLASNGSFMTVKDGYAYVGSYSKDGDGKAGALYRYAINPDGSLAESREGPIRIPDRAQGVTVVDGALLFTTGAKELVYQPFDESSFTANIDDRRNIANGQIDPYAQGLNIIDGELWVTYESGSHKYDQNVDTPREHIQRIPLDRLDLEAAGLTPEDLTG